MPHDFTLWWKDWWEEDYSWDGLAKKPLAGWYVTARGKIVEDPENWPEDHANYKARPRGARDATLQDYWRDQKNALIKSPVSGIPFTIMHLPLAWEDGTPTPGVQQLEVLKAKYLASAANEHNADRQLISPDRRMMLTGTVLREFNLGLIASTDVKVEHIPAHISALRCFFVETANFRSAAFSGDADFDGAAFSGYAYFHFAVFSQDAYFHGADFAQGADFDVGAFWGDATFESAVFSGTADFGSAVFWGSAKFDSAAFSPISNFDSAAFLGKAYFNSVTFSGDAYFRNAAFSGSAQFSGAAFCGNAYFNGAIFTMKVNFSGVGDLLILPEQSQNLTLTATPNPAILLEGLLIAPKTPSPLANRSFKSIDASGAIFLDEATFDNRDIHEPSSFRDCLFMNRASFHGSKLHQGVTFHGAVFEACLSPARQCVNGAKNDPVYATPQRALTRLHEAEAKLRSRLGKPKITYKSWLAAFEANRDSAAKDFCALPQKTKNGETGDSKDRYFADLEDAFRTLKRAMEDNRNRPEEGRFFKLELQARRRRRHPAVPWWERAMSDLYLWSSDFGMSVVRPIAWLGVTTVLFACLYASLATFPERSPKGVELAEATSFSLGRVLPFGPWADDPVACSAAGRLLDIAPSATEIATNTDCRSDLENQYGPFTALGVRFLASLQSFIALVLVFLAALASRRRFQIS